MKTVEERAHEYALKVQEMDSFSVVDLYKDIAREIQTFIPITEELPPEKEEVIFQFRIKGIEGTASFMCASLLFMNRLEDITITHWRPIEYK